MSQPCMHGVYMTPKSRDDPLSSHALPTAGPAAGAQRGGNHAGQLPPLLPSLGWTLAGAGHPRQQQHEPRPAPGARWERRREGDVAIGGGRWLACEGGFCCGAHARRTLGSTPMPAPLLAPSAFKCCARRSDQPVHARCPTLFWGRSGGTPLLTPPLLPLTLPSVDPTRVVHQAWC